MGGQRERGENGGKVLKGNSASVEIRGYGGKERRKGQSGERSGRKLRTRPFPFWPVINPVVVSDFPCKQVKS